MMLNRFTRIIDRIEGQIINWSAPSSLVPKDIRYLVAVSGGADSMCLADLCLKHLGPSRFAVAHCNFHLRGNESDADEALVASWASNNGVVFHRVDFDTEEYSMKNGISIEMAARDLRYGWFAEICGKYGFAGVMTAHNANDNAETLILNLLRGSGIHGICGMEEIFHYHTDRNEGTLVFRPMLKMTRKQIEGHVFAWKIPYRNDSTNALSDYKRNRIRNEVFPHFEKINPSFVQTLNREMTYFTDAADIVDEWCRERSAKCISRSEDISDMRISIPHLLSESRWRYLLYHILSPFGFNAAVLSSLEDLLVSGRTVSGKSFESDTHVLMTERNEFIVLSRSVLDDKGGVDLLRPGHLVPTMRDEVIMTVRGAGTYNFNGRSFTVEVLQWTAGMPVKQPEGILIMDADKISFPFVCRRWNQGDWFRPLGLRGKKKISDLFTDLKYDTFSKASAVVIVDCKGSLAEERHIAGVLGLRIDERYKITPSTTRIIKIKIN